MLRLSGIGAGLLHSHGVFKVSMESSMNENAHTKGAKQDPGKKHNGVSTPKLFVPIIAILVVMHAMIIFLIISINSTSGSLSQTMQSSGTYVSDVSALMAGSSMLSETSSNYILLPVLEDGSPNVGPLMAYAGEIGNDRRGPDVLARFQNYNVSPEVLSLIEEAAGCADGMIQNQLHAIALITSVYTLPPIPDLQSLPLPELTAEEQAYTPEQKVTQARLLILDENQAALKSTLSADANQAMGLIQGASAQTSALTSQKLGTLRYVMWAVTLSIIVILFVVFIILYGQLINPLRNFVRLIADDHSLDEKKGLEEVRLVATAYNSLMERRDALDTILRSAAETDTLTNLQNRYGYEKYILEAADDSSSMAIFLFDVNYLKETNDQFGHSAGDKLLKDSAECIATCFGSSEESECFRIGGDEFAAVIRNSDPVKIGKMIERFEKLQRADGLSISWGYEYVDSMDNATVKELFNQADKNMYEHKKRVHEMHDKELGSAGKA